MTNKLKLAAALLVIFAPHYLMADRCMAEVFYAQDEALELAFPEHNRIEKQTFVMTGAQKEEVEKAAKVRIESNLFTFYKGYKEDQLLGYAAIDTHMVRSMTETFMVVLTPEGASLKTVILAFNEPPEYIASQRWLDQFNGKNLDNRLWPGQEIHGIVGSTLTANAMTAGVRKILALHKVLISKG
ncbi:MAG: FMN-binding protein [Deltaproteobacteria bacterium]|nr:FMN-binding protein [Deltaproteobacteria bacterium]